MTQILFALLTIVIGVGGCLAYFYLANMVLDRVLPPRRGRPENLRRSSRIRPWIFLAPAIVLLGVYLVYPLFASVWLSLSRDGEFTGLANYIWMVQDPKFRESLFNNVLWLIFVPTLSTLVGLVAAQLTDSIKWGTIAKSLIFMPMAISFVGAAVIWKFIYEFRAGDQTQIGLLNAVVTSLGGEPQAWLTLPIVNTFFLMIIMVWMQAGFAMVLLSAALRGIPDETIEAAILDGASPWKVFWRIQVPQIYGTIAVVWTTITIMVLKIFDIVFAITNGQWGTQVLANLMYDWSFRAGDFNRGATIAIVIMVAVLPIMIWNIRNAQKEED
ncbi:carbohydrate ABC transporter permease [Falsirhodobacter algicola]|uniref:ABC transporter permease subunit n=1 Tax=Falsirhodobacter algicola TaxID=2692330 RepID=A0A8J8MS88_9RHOB|nr:sugar ABC transporter permease [Falsirhodobacter algicola]QUS35574.1 ABC transporter permease subunit [Falsirhodobacter algicola]